MINKSEAKHLCHFFASLSTLVPDLVFIITASIGIISICKKLAKTSFLYAQILDSSKLIQQMAVNADTLSGHYMALRFVVVKTYLSFISW